MKLTLAALLALGTLAPLAQSCAQPEAAPPPAPGTSAQTSTPAPPDTFLVRIEPEGDSLRAVPDTVVVKPGDVVQWTSDVGEWRVIFQSPIPFGPDAVSRGIRGGKGQKNGQAVRPRAAKGRYKYMITALDGSHLRKRDPEVVVDPGEEPGRF